MSTDEEKTTSWFVDLEHLGQSRVVAAHILEGGAGLAIIDPGPASTLPALERGLAARGYSVDSVGAILLTHIHLDHAGATGSLVKANPRISVYVHEKGAQHLIAPDRLVASASRLYGDAMDLLWGPFLAVPTDNVHALSGGERISVAGRAVDVAYTPGHASHHVSFLDTATGTAFTGDVAGCRIDGAPYVFPPTVPPDIDIELWLRSIDLIDAWAPSDLGLTHFGVVSDVREHLEELRTRLSTWSQLTRPVLEADRHGGGSQGKFAEKIALELRAKVGDALAQCYEQCAPPAMCWAGLARYHKKKELP